MKITINDVAKAAGVSKATVSRVLSNSERISDDTKRKVNDVIKNMGYIPNATARNLAKNSTKTIGIVIPMDAGSYFYNDFYIKLMQGISSLAQKKGYYIMYAFGNDKDEDKVIKDLCSKGVVDGIIMLKTEQDDKTINYLADRKFPFVVIGKPLEDNNVLWVDNDNYKIAYDLVCELIKNGHKKICFIGAQEKWMVYQERIKGYKKALEDNNIQYDTNLVYCGEEFSDETGLAGIKEVLSKSDPTAVIAIDDLVAVGINKYFNMNSIRDKALIGFNNTMLANYQAPSISSVEIYGDKLGYYAAELLVNHLEKIDDASNYKIIDSKIIYRQTYNSIIKRQ